VTAAQRPGFVEDGGGELLLSGAGELGGGVAGVVVEPGAGDGALLSGGAPPGDVLVVLSVGAELGTVDCWREHAAAVMSRAMESNTRLRFMEQTSYESSW
jgi:hypothetical protein